MGADDLLLVSIYKDGEDDSQTNDQVNKMISDTETLDSQRTLGTVGELINHWWAVALLVRGGEPR